MADGRGLIRIFLGVIPFLIGMHVASLSTPAFGGWFLRLIDNVGDAAGDSRKVGRGGRFADLGTAGVFVKALPEGGRGHAIAASVSDDGHWHLMNGKGEGVTVSGSEELDTALKWMVGEDFNRDRRLITFYIAEDGLFRNPEFIKILPARARHVVVSRGKTYPVLTKRVGGLDVLYGKLRKNIEVPLESVEVFREAVWQIEQPLKRSSIRLLVLAPDGAKKAPVTPIIGTSGLPEPDIVDAYALKDVFGSLRGQTVMLTGKVDGDLLYFKKSGEADLSIFVTDIAKAARANDINLIVLNIGKSRQPGRRDWLWRKVGINGLERAVLQKSFGDFLSVLGEGRGGFDIRLDGTKRKRALITAKQRVMSKDILDIEDGQEYDPFDSIVTDVVSAIRGDYVVGSIVAEMRSSSRQVELDSRIIPGIPSDWQFFYLGSIILGLLGFPAARRWWHRLWPPEDHAEYRTRAALGGAVAIRWVLFLAVFLPIVGVAAFLVNLDGLARRIIMAPYNWFAGRKA